MVIGKHRPTKRVVDCHAIQTNIQHEIKRLPEGTDLFAVVKANGYGHGALKVAQVAKDNGAKGFCVAVLDEALELREAGFTDPIIILGVVPPQYIELVLAHDLVTTAPSLDWLAAAADYYQRQALTTPVRIHLKIDTGMGRLGLRGEAEIKAALALFAETQCFALEGVFTHFAKADAVDTSYLTLQQERFSEALALLPADIRYIHAANSATALWHHHWRSNLVRCGVTMYGLNPSGHELAAPYALQPALSLTSELVQVKLVGPGEHLSYGGDYVTTTDEWIGTLPIGYADGLIRAFTGFNVEVEGELVPIVGRICMDQCMIRLPRQLAVGTTVTIYSNQPDAPNNLQGAADYIGTINYEIPCLLSERVPIEYLE